MNMGIKFIAIIVFLTTSYSVSASTISNNAIIDLLQLNHFEPLGQSFTAIDTNVEAGLSFDVMNGHLANDSAINYILYEGQGVSGAELASITFSLEDTFSGIYMADFTSINLTVGSVYSLVASVVDSSPYWGLRGGTALDGGEAVYGGITNTVEDMQISVDGVSAVPVPAAVWLFGSALLGFIGFSRATLINSRNRIPSTRGFK
ncbi:MAG: hypothetical protein RPU64_07730 [Candidatus Sedimenticola sp. (ex Thyasira tokunagai)]